MKRSLLLVLALIAVCVCMTACGASEESQQSQESQQEVEQESPAAEETEPKGGGWELVSNEASKLPKDVDQAFQEAIKAYNGGELKPVAFLATQVVAGTNFMLLCEEEGLENLYKMVVVYQDLEGNAELTQAKDFDLSEYVNGESTEVDQEELAGGWVVADDRTGTAIPGDAKAAFDKAAETFTGSTLEPLALLGTQVVAGRNYAFLCCSTPATKNPIPGIQVVTVYEDPEGNEEITGLMTVDPADFNQ